VKIVIEPSTQTRDLPHSGEPFEFHGSVFIRIRNQFGDAIFGCGANRIYGLNLENGAVTCIYEDKFDQCHAIQPKGGALTFVRA